MQSKLDPFHLQIVVHYLKKKEDFLNVIQVNKQYHFLLDRLRINPIPIKEETQKLFQYLDTQQIFTENQNEIMLNNIKILQINYEITYSKYLKLEEQYKDKQLKCKRVTYSKEERIKYGNTIPKEVSILETECFKKYNGTVIVIPSNVKEIRLFCFY